MLPSGWSVESVGSFSASDGEVRFRNQDRTVTLFWSPIENLPELQNDRRLSAFGTSQVEALGTTVELFDYGFGEARAVWSSEQSAIEAVALPTDPQGLGDLVRQIEVVDVDSWLSALPADVVRPDDQTALVQELLIGVPLPPGLEASDLSDADAVGNRTQAGIAVLSPVVCGWIDTWLDARDRGDVGEAAAVERVLGDVRQWPVVRGFEQGFWLDSLLQRTDAVATGSLITDGNTPEPISRDNLSGIGC
ncbi:MAG: hypothetical protein ACRDZ2_14685 [Ilumatobacteraceae bacterium]